MRKYMKSDEKNEKKNWIESQSKQRMFEKIKNKKGERGP